MSADISGVNTDVSGGWPCEGMVDMFEVFLAIAEVGTGYLSSRHYDVKTQETDDDGGNEVNETFSMTDFMAKAVAKKLLMDGHKKEYIVEGMKRAGFEEENLIPNEDRFMSVFSYRYGGSGGKRKTLRRTRRKQRI